MALIELRNLHQSYGSVNALRDLTLDVPEGCLFGLLGPNGAGKTTAIRCILGLLAPSAGQVSIFGEHDPVQRLRNVGAMVETHKI